MSISDLRCVQRARNTSWSPGVSAEVWRGQRSGALILICVINSASFPYFVLPSSTNRSNPLLSAPPLPSQLHRPSSHPSLTQLPSLISKSLRLSRRDLNLKTPDSIWSVFITHSGATGSAEVGDDRGWGWWAGQLPALVLIMLKSCCHQAQRPTGKAYIKRYPDFNSSVQTLPHISIKKTNFFLSYFSDG